MPIPFSKLFLGALFSPLCFGTFENHRYISAYPCISCTAVFFQLSTAWPSHSQHAWGGLPPSLEGCLVFLFLLLFSGFNNPQNGALSVSCGFPAKSQPERVPTTKGTAQDEVCVLRASTSHFSKMKTRAWDLGAPGIKKISSCTKNGMRGRRSSSICSSAAVS